MRTVLIANRGEIAVRVARACREAGLRAVAVYSEVDRGAPHVLAADQAVPVGPAPARDSYLNVEALLAAARTAAADAVHPGYGFLAESAAFAEAVEAAGLVWIGPPPGAIATMGDKLAARATVARAGVPLVPGTALVAGDAAGARRQVAAPCPVLTPRLRAEMTAAALATARAVGYTNAGTVEFLLDADGRFYFLEMNTRVQVEHPITEWVTGIDIVAAQLRIAAGQPLGFAQSDVVPRGHAIEVRLYAEDPARSLFPSPGPILALSEPSRPGVRVDSGVVAGGVVPVEYDPLLAKISAWAPDRTVAVRRLRAALEETVVLGPTTNLPFLLDVLGHPAFLAGDTHTGFLAEHLPEWRPGGPDETTAAVAAAIALSRPAAPSGGDRAAAPTPWETLGPWRLGAQR